MQASLLIIGVLAPGARASVSGATRPKRAGQSSAAEEACGRRAVPALKGSRSPRDVLYSVCRRDTLRAMPAQEAPTDAN